MPLFLIPLAGFVFVGKNFIQPLNLILVFLELIVAPMIISQVLVKFKLEKHVAKWRGAIVNWGLFVVIFAVISLNRDIFFQDFKTLAKISLICVLTIFTLWFLTNFVLIKLKVLDEIKKSLILAATIKNSGFAAATALTLFNEKASLPGAVFSVFLIIFFNIYRFEATKKSTR